MKKASIIAIGNEVLSGKTLNTNGQIIAQKLSQSGYNIVSQLTTQDNIDRIMGALELSYSDISGGGLIVTIGGLGPTLDDVTKSAVSTWISSKSDEAIPVAIANPNGTASGLFFTLPENVSILLLPGPPRECLAVFDNAHPLLPKSNQTTVHYRIVGVKELDIEPLLEEFEIKEIILKHPQQQIGIYPAYGFVDLALSSVLPFQPESLENLQRDIKSLPQALFIPSNKSIEEVIADLCIERKWSLATCESCTGGSLSGRFTSIAGISAIFQGGCIAYTPEIKERLLHIPLDVQQKYGLVSKEIADEMALSAQRIFGSDVVCATTGFFGPSGGDAPNDPPIGTAFISIISPLGKETLRFFGKGDRPTLRDQCIGYALQSLLLHLKRGQSESA